MYIMKPYSYFENILQKKRYFNNSEIKLMSPNQIRAYRITGHIRRYNNSNEIKKLQALVRKIENHKV